MPNGIYSAPQEGQMPPRPIPQQRVIAKMDEYMDRRDYAGAERHLRYWLEEARQNGDKRGELMVRNELVGHYRKTGEREKAFEQIEAALALVHEMGFEGSISAGTTCVNAATALNAFGENERALGLFQQAREIYESSEATEAKLLGGLYNNMALTCVALGRYSEARALYALAMEMMGTVPAGALEQAITCLNLANLAEAEKGMEGAEREIDGLLEQASALLDQEELPRDGYYAFVCEKCAPSFDYYGWFVEAERLRALSKEIYERA